MKKTRRKRRRKRRKTRRKIRGKIRRKTRRKMRSKRRFRKKHGGQGGGGGDAAQGDGDGVICPPGAKRFVIAHSAMEEEGFIVPEDVYIITLMHIGDKCPLDQQVWETIMQLYERGYTLFENDDKSTEQTEAGHGVEQLLNTIFHDDERVLKGKGFKIRNHIPGTIANDQILHFFGDTTDGLADLHIVCFNKTWLRGWPAVGHFKGKKNYVRYEYGSEPITLSDLVAREGAGVYILLACRGVGDIPEANVKVMRQRSEDYYKVFKDPRQKTEAKTAAAAPPPPPAAAAPAPPLSPPEADDDDDDEFARALRRAFQRKRKTKKKRRGRMG